MFKKFVVLVFLAGGLSATPLFLASASAESTPDATEKQAAAANLPAPAADSHDDQKMSFTDLFKQAQAGEVDKAAISDVDYAVKVTRKDGDIRYVATPANSHDWIVDLIKTGAQVSLEHGKVTEQSKWETFSDEVNSVGQGFGVVLGILLPLLLVGVLIWQMKSITGNNGSGKFIPPHQPGAVTFDDVAGAQDAKQALMDIVDYLRNPQKFKDAGARQRRGILLIGPPGNGKTLVARALAEEAGVPFMAVSGSSFVEMFVGRGASRVRSMFKRLKKKAPCVLFIDEIDSLGRKRGGGGGGDAEYAQTLNQLLIEMDGISTAAGIVIIAATNRIDIMDEALLRPGRFDLHATIPNPGPKAREQVLSIHARKINVAADVDFALIARGTPGFSGADLANLLNEGAIRAAKDGRTEVTAKDIDDSKDTKLLGGDVPAEKVLDEAEQAIVAVHESGHAIISLLEGDHDPIHKGTVVPRGRSLGVVVSAPTRDRALLSKRYLKARLTLMMGGRAAEELKFGADMITSGAVADIEEATRIARIMVSKYGFGLKISTRDPNSSAAFGMSEKSKEDVDAEVENLVQEALSRAMEIMSANRPALDALSSRFLRDETLNGEEIRSIVFEAIKTSTPVSVDNLNIKAVA